MEITNMGDLKYKCARVVHVQGRNVSLVFLWINPTIQGWIVERLDAPARDLKEVGIVVWLEVT
jgi:hypothetical protein